MQGNMVTSLFRSAHRAIKSGRVDTLRQLLDNGLEPNTSNKLGWTLLMLAALQGDVPCGRLLLDRAADPNTTNRFADTPLALAVNKGHVRFASLLIDAGARTNSLPPFDELRASLLQSSGLPTKQVDSIIQDLQKLLKMGHIG